MILLDSNRDSKAQLGVFFVYQMEKLILDVMHKQSTISTPNQLVLSLQTTLDMRITGYVRLCHTKVLSD